MINTFLSAKFSHPHRLATPPSLSPSPIPASVPRQTFYCEKIQCGDVKLCELLGSKYLKIYDAKRRIGIIHVFITMLFVINTGCFFNQCNRYFFNNSANFQLFFILKKVLKTFWDVLFDGKNGLKTKWKERDENWIFPTCYIFQYLMNFLIRKNQIR